MFYNINELLGFFLVFIRMTSFLVVSPFFSLRNIPNLVKVLFGLVLAFVVFPVIEIGTLPVNSIFAYFLLILSEVTVGLAIGFVSTILFSAFRVAGQLIDLQIGYAMTQIFDPSQGAQNTITGQFLHLLSLVIFLSLNGHHSLILALVKSFELVPLSQGKVTGTLAQQMLTSFTGMITIAFQIAVPVLAVLIVIDISLGMIGKTVPQLNVFMTGFPLKIGMGLLVIAVTLPIVVSISQFIFNQMEKDVLGLLRSMT